MLRLLVNYGENQELPIVMALCNSVSCDDMVCNFFFMCISCECILFSAYQIM